MADTPTRTRRPVPPTVTGTPVPDRPPMSYEDRFARLLDVAAVEEPEASDVRPVITLDEEGMESFRRWADAKYVANIYGEVTKAGNEEVSKACFAAWVDALWRHKVRPNNPELKDVDAAGNVIVETIFVVKEDCKFVVPKSKEDFKIVLVKELSRRFEATGMLENEARADAEAIVGTCVDLRPKLGAIDMNYDPDEKASLTVAKCKLADLMAWDGAIDTKPAALTDAERKMLLTRKLEPEVKDDFFTRVVGMVKSKDQLKAVLEVIVPGTSITAPQYGDTDKTKLDQLISDARKAIEGKATK